MAARCNVFAVLKTDTEADPATGTPPHPPVPFPPLNAREKCSHFLKCAEAEP